MDEVPDGEAHLLEFRSRQDRIVTVVGDDDWEEDGALASRGGECHVVRFGAELAGERLDKALAAQMATLSRSRLQSLIAGGLVSMGGETVRDASAKALADIDYRVQVPSPEPAVPRPQAIALDILFEDAHVVVVDKRAGMAAHPAPGTPDATLVNALLHHCAGSLSGIGGVLRPGIVHRLDKDTSGVMVAAKTDAAHRGLSALFAAHQIERVYLALTRGAPDPSRGAVATRLGRSPHDRKKMAIVKTGGREAVTHYGVEKSWRATDTLQARPAAARVRCRLETGRTHQIRVHLASRGAPCLGDPLYGSGSPASAVRDAMSTAGFRRQALHAAVLGFDHPVTGAALRFQTEPPEDMAQLERELDALYISELDKRTP